MRWCVPLSELSARDLAQAGGKGANLGELIRTGFPVPAGIVVTTQAYREATVELANPTQDAVRALPMPEPICRQLLAGYAELGRGPVAVRSSATAEDLPGAAFAGQQDTFLGVEGDQAVVAAVRDCWASLFTERAVAYRARLGVDPATVAMAVVIQRMVPAELAGVMLTANPVTGARDQTVVDSSPGLGEAVVAGLVTPDHALLGRDGAVISRQEGHGGTATGHAVAARLSEAQLAELARLGHAVQAHFGRPMDIEWALAKGRFLLLQARPMTALPPAPIRVGRLRRQYARIEMELLTRRPLPLEVDGWISLVIAPLLNGMWRGIAGVRVDLGAMVLVEDGIVTEAIPLDPKLLPRMPLTILRSLLRTGRNPRDWRRDPRYPGYLRACQELDAQDPSRLGWGSLLAGPQRARSLMMVLTGIRVSWLPAALVSLGGLRLVLRALHLNGQLLDLLCNVPSVTQALNRELGEVAETLRAEPRLWAVFEPQPSADRVDLADPATAGLRRWLADFLEQYGNRESSSLLLLADPTWGADPAPVMDLIAVLARQPRQPLNSEAQERARARLLGHPWVSRLRLRRVVERLVRRTVDGLALREDTHFEATRTMAATRRAYLEIGARLAAAGALASADDVWYLTWAEISRLTDPARGPMPRLVSASRRRAAYAELGSTPLVSPLTLFGDEPLPDDALVSGIGAGGGRVSGPVRVIHGPSEFGRLQPGEVLVCRATNPSWTPLFARAGAVVVDLGGMASHAAIVARECGIPAVMGSLTGTTVLHDGQQVVVDGDRGVVRSI